MRAILLVIAVMAAAFDARAEGGCPAGMIPYRGNDLSSCGPIPAGYNKPPAQPAGPRWADRWGAIVIDKGRSNVGLGVAKGMKSRRQAEKAALQECREKGGEGCELSLSYYNQCAVVVASPDYYVTQRAATIEEASALGMKDCGAESSAACTVYYSACSLPERTQ